MTTPFAAILMLRAQEEMWRYAYVLSGRALVCAAVLGVGGALVAFGFRRHRERTDGLRVLRPATR